MSTIDIRNEQPDVTEVRFFDDVVGSGNVVAATLRPWCGRGVKLSDKYSFVNVCSKAHADNLRKALDKAAELGWLK